MNISGPLKIIVGLYKLKSWEPTWPVGLKMLFATLLHGSFSKKVVLGCSRALESIILDFCQVSLLCYLWIYISIHIGT